MDPSAYPESNSRERTSTPGRGASQEDSAMSGIDDSDIPQHRSSDNAVELQDLGVNFVDQNVLERELMAKV